MKKLEIIIRPEKLEEAKNVLSQFDVSGLMISHIMGYGNQKGYTQLYRGTEYEVTLRPKMKIETVICEDKVESLISKITETLKTGSFGDGKIFVYNVEDAIRVRTGEKGIDAL